MATNMKIPQRLFMFWSTAVVCPQVRTHEHICRGIRRLIFRQFPVAFVLPDTCKKNILGNVLFSDGMWNVKMSGRPDGLFGVAQIMVCVIENSIAKVPATVAQYPFFFHRQPQLSQGKASPIMTIFYASPTFEGEASDGCKKTRRPVVSATSATASVSVRDRSMEGLLRSLHISSENPQQKLGALRGAPKNKLARCH